ncbi:hypothetical protein RND71_040418 [Anisodus tanguticus]|uniref:Uncharacterized protein n=1 Tax=Anisodus tanguticus TaxID=243964 RepID=A0AAE1QTC5_9SOLA|nr:hypothetical protein RND71_040418 [Anisodus tanguticus]
MKVKFWSVSSHRLKGKLIFLPVSLVFAFFVFVGGKISTTVADREIETVRNSDIALPEKLWFKVGSHSLEVIFSVYFKPNCCRLSKRKND